MRLALVAGMSLNEFYNATVGEIVEVINAHNDRKRQDITAQVSAVMRALSAAFGGSADPYQGLIERPQTTPVSVAEVRRLRFWRESD